jgi:hypothetical protein
MIELLLELARDLNRDQDFRQELSAHISAVKASAGAGDRRQVGKIEAAVRANPSAMKIFFARCERAAARLFRLVLLAYPCSAEPGAEKRCRLRQPFHVDVEVKQY